MPRRCAPQVHRPNVGGSIEEYYRRTIYVPYTPYFHIFALHPREMQQTERDEFKHIISSVKEMYGIDNLVEEALVWYDVQKHKPLDDNSLGMIELVKQTTLFPAVRKAIPHRTDSACNIMSFSTPRRVKPWLRSTMDDKSLSGLCMLNVHRDKVNSQKSELMNRVIDNFGRDPRRLQFLFQE